MKIKKLINWFLAVLLLISCLPLKTVIAETTTFLPGEFISSAIGNDETIGGGNFNLGTKQFTIDGSGKQIGKDPGATDSYQFVNMKQSGNFTFTARLVNYDSSNAMYGQAGIFVRTDNTSVDANYFGAYIEPSKNQFRYAYRDTSVNKSGAAVIAGFDSSSENVYMKIERNGNQFKISVSTDAFFSGSNTSVNTQTVNMPDEDVYLGFVVANGGLGKSSQATFDQVTIEQNGTLLFDSSVIGGSLPDTTDLPAGFTKLDIGTVTEQGNTVFDSTTGAFTVTGSGLDIAKDATKDDSFHFSNYAITGNFSVTARIFDFMNSSAPNSKAGLLIRDDITGNSANYIGIIYDTLKKEVRNSYRNFTSTENKAGASIFNNNLVGLPTELFVNITRNNNRFTYSISTDPEFSTDNTYTKTRTVVMDDTVYIGFGVANGAKNTGAAVVNFDNVTIEQNEDILFDSMSEVVAPPLPLGSPSNVVSTVTENQVALSWDAAENATGYEVRRASEENGTYTTIATLSSDVQTYIDQTTEAGQSYFYKIVSVNDLGETAESDIHAVTIEKIEAEIKILLQDENQNSISTLQANSRVIAATDLSEVEVETASLIVVLYDENNSVVSMTTAETTTSNTLQASLLLPETVDGYTLKAFVWDSLDEVTPLAEAVTIQ